MADPQCGKEPYATGAPYMRTASSSTASMPVYGSCWPKPPTKVIKCGPNGLYRRRVTTEFHDALVSLGTNDRTESLSKEEFLRQFASEVGYLTNLSGAYLGRAATNFGKLVNLLFND